MYKTQGYTEKRHIKKSTRILIIDDEATARETFAAILRDHGYKVETAKDGCKAIEKAKKKLYDIALIDIVLDEIDGVATFEALKKVNSHLVAIMMTAYSVEDMVKAALERGAYTCIYKPFDIDGILNLIEKICDTKLH